MKRYIVVGVRQNKDNKTGEDLLFVTMYKLASKTKDGGLWHPKKDESVVNGCINKSRSPEEYKKFSEILPGTLMDVTMGINDFNGKIFVAKMEVVPDTCVFAKEQVYI